MGFGPPLASWDLDRQQKSLVKVPWTELFSLGNHLLAPLPYPPLTQPPSSSSRSLPLPLWPVLTYIQGTVLCMCSLQVICEALDQGPTCQWGFASILGTVGLLLATCHVQLRSRFGSRKLGLSRAQWFSQEELG